MQAKKQQIEEFWAQKRLALAGVSRNEEHFSRRVFEALQERGYQVYPVNPEAGEIEGQPCYARVDQISPAVDGVIIMTPPEATESIVRDCVSAGVPRVWMHRGEGIGAVSEPAVAYAVENGLDVIPGHCPFMFMPDTQFFHKIHGFVLRLQGRYPN